MLEDASIPVAKGDICYDEEDLEYTIKNWHPIVMKPLNGNHGKAPINVTNWEDAVVGLAILNNTQEK